MQNQYKNTEKDGEKAWSMHKAIEENEKQRRQLLLENMELIHEMHAQRLYCTILGDENAPWSAYLGQHELFYSTSKIYTLDKIYGKFVKELGIDVQRLASIPNTKLSNLISVVNLDNIEEWLTKAETLTTQDFDDELRKVHGKISYLDCDHHNKKVYSICQSCGFRHQGEHEERKN